MTYIYNILGLILLGVTPDWVYTVIGVIIILFWLIIACIPYFIFKKNKSRKLWVDIIGSLICLYAIYYIYNSAFNNNWDTITYVISTSPYVLILMVYWVIIINNYREKKYQEEQDFFKDL